MITNATADSILNTIFGGTKYLALFNEDPTPEGLLTNEMSGSGYVRKPVVFSNASGKTVLISTDIWWVDLPYTPIKYVAVCSTLSGGTMIAYQLVSAGGIYVTGTQRFTITSGKLGFTLI